jgi:hypothetical protein
MRFPRPSVIGTHPVNQLLSRHQAPRCHDSPFPRAPLRRDRVQPGPVTRQPPRANAPAPPLLVHLAVRDPKPWPSLLALGPRGLGPHPQPGGRPQAAQAVAAPGQQWGREATHRVPQSPAPPEVGRGRGGSPHAQPSTGQGLGSTRGRGPRLCHPAPRRRGGRPGVPGRRRPPPPPDLSAPAAPPTGRERRQPAQAVPRFFSGCRPERDGSASAWPGARGRRAGGAPGASPRRCPGVGGAPCHTPPRQRKARSTAWWGCPTSVASGATHRVTGRAEGPRTRPGAWGVERGHRAPRPPTQGE